MEHYHITLCLISWNLCTIALLPWGKFEYQKLPMELCSSPDVFQKIMNMNELFNCIQNENTLEPILMVY